VSVAIGHGAVVVAHAGFHYDGCGGGSIVGTFIGGLLLGFVPNYILLPLLAALLLISAVRMWRHQ